MLRNDLLIIHTLCITLVVLCIHYGHGFNHFTLDSPNLTPSMAVKSSTSPAMQKPEPSTPSPLPQHGLFNEFNNMPVSIKESLNRREEVSREVSQILYEDMLKGRYLEDMCAQMYYRSKVSGFVHLYSGQEAISTGVIKLLRKDDYVVSTYRDHVHAASKGVPISEVLAELYGKETGCSKGRGGSMHMFSKEYNMMGGFAYIGEQIPIALGTAFASAYRKNTPKIHDESANQVTVCFMGDGTANIGQFYESLNLASLAKLPIIFVIENNNWAIGMASYRSTSVPELYKKAEVFGIPGYEVDGMDVLSVRSIAREAIKRARNGYGPTVIEAMTYRFRGHSLADPDELRAPLERKVWQDRDPIAIFGEYMKDMGYANDALLKYTQKKVRNMVKEAADFAEDSLDPPLSQLGDYIFGDHYTPENENLTPEQLNAYAKALGEELNLQARKNSGEKVPNPRIELSTSPNIVID